MYMWVIEEGGGKVMLQGAELVKVDNLKYFASKLQSN